MRFLILDNHTHGHYDYISQNIFTGKDLKKDEPGWSNLP